MKGVEKITAVRLAEILTERGAVPSEVVTDALYSQDKSGEPFVQVLVGSGHITEWDLAKLVTENFNLPFLMASHYQIVEAAKSRFPKEVLFRHTMVPLDVFDDIVCVAMPVMLTYEEISKIQKEHGCTLFPYVGLISENKKVLTDLFKEYPSWVTEQQQQRNDFAEAAPKAPATDWMSIFDAGEEAIRAGIKKGPTKR